MGRKAVLWIVCSLCLSLAARAQELKIIVPAYFYPGGEGAKDWQRLNAAAQKAPLWVIINPASGPGRQTDPVYSAAYKALRAAHGKTLAYVDTSYAKRPIDRVLKDIDQWLAFYPGQADGFFLDQITYDDDPAHLDYLARVYRYIKGKSRKLLVMGNPGTNTREAYLKRPVCDAMMTFENFASEYPNYQPDAWASRYRPDQFAHILHSAPPSEEALRKAILTLQQRRAGWIFITDAVYTKAHPNPYNRLPTYWEKEVEAVQKLAEKQGSTPEPKPTLAERLGYKATDKLLIIHADDVGMCHSVNVATIQAMEKGVVTCASIMVPCPWMPEIAAYCREHPEADFGLHLTLTSEWQYYRWRPVLPINEVPGLLDKEGFLPRSVEETVAQASREEVEKELRAQIRRAQEFGIKPTHVDSHMGTLFMGKFFPAYVQVAKEFGLLPMLLQPTPERIQQGKAVFGTDPARIAQELAPQGYVFLDRLYETAQGDTLEARREHYYTLFRNLKPGVTEIIVHLAMNDDEAQHITYSWRQRYYEYQILTDPKTRELLDSLGIKRIGYRQLMPLAYKQP